MNPENGWIGNVACETTSAQRVLAQEIDAAERGDGKKGKRNCKAPPKWSCAVVRRLRRVTHIDDRDDIWLGNLHHFHGFQLLLRHAVCACQGACLEQ